MYPRTQKFDDTIRQGHIVVSSVTLLPSVGNPVSFSVESGYVNVADEAIRRRCTLTTKLIDLTLIPDGLGDLISPTTEFMVERGIKYSDGTSEYLPLGVFGISDVKLNYNGEAVSLIMDGYDRARKVRRARMPNDYIIASGTNIKTGLQALLQSRYSTIKFAASWKALQTSATFNSVVLMTGDDPWDFARKVAQESLASDLFFDVNGELSIVQIFNATAANSVWTYETGSEAIILAASRRLQDEESYNHVVVTGEHPDNARPVRGEAFDDNPASATYYLGSYGDVPYFVASEFIRTAEQATETAAARLSKVLGEAEEVNFVSMPHPAHEVGDVITITVSKLGINAIYILDKFNIGLSESDPMNASTRKRRV